MKKYDFIQILIFIFLSSLLSGCHYPNGGPLPYSKKSSHVRYVETEDINPSIADEEDQELRDEV